MAAVPADMLLDSKYLEQLRKAGADTRGNGYRYDTILQSIKYASIKPRYQVIANQGLNYQQTSVQIKTLNKPYIPGSTIKGTIMHAVLYRWVKEHYKESGIESIIADGKPNSFSAKYLFDQMLGADIYTRLSNALLCEDVYFDKIGLYDRNRSKSGSKDFPLPNCEAIVPGETAEQTIFTIQKDRLKLQLEADEEISYKAREFADSLDEKCILEALRITTEDNLEIEMDYDFEDESIRNQLKQLQSKAKNSFIMRTGNSTDYWEKSISGLVKKNNPQFYRENFGRKFSPLGPKLSPSKMPVTRVVLDDGSGPCLAGYLEIIQ